MPINNHTPNTDKSLEQWLWDAACSIRGAKEAAKYKDFILPLVFTKRLCDVFDDGGRCQDCGWHGLSVDAEISQPLGADLVLL